jgi:riboflavin synthase alpha subunit
MKKTLVFSLLVAGFSLSASAQKLKESQVPAVVKSAFTKEHPNTIAQWEKEEGNYEVVFKQDGKTMSSVIDKKGSVLENETDLTANELPQNIQSYLKQHYKGANITGAAKVVKANGEVNYEANVNKKEIMFDANGQVMKKQKEEKEDEDKEGKKGKD